MTKSEQVTLRALAKSMMNSTTTSWTSGDVQDFKAWAANMRSRIITASSVIEELCKLPPEDEKPLESGNQKNGEDLTL